MKYTLLLLLSVCIIQSCAPKIYELNNGKMISERKLHKIARKALLEVERSMTKEELNLLNGDFKYQVDTLTIKEN